MGKNNVPKIRWVCLCDCGTVKPFVGERLKSGNTKSCGCLQTKVRIENNRKYKKKHNHYDLSGEYGIGYTDKGEQFTFDLEDYELIYPYSWSMDTQGYIIANCGFLTGKHTTVKLQRIVMDAPSNMMVDHINHDKSNNRKSNLRIVTNQQNCWNRSAQTTCSSGVPGVRQFENGWVARINVDKKEKYLGYFKTFEEAVKARKEAEKKYYG